MPHGMCYSYYGNLVRNGVISIAQWGLLSDCYKVNPIGKKGKILVIAMGLIDSTLGPWDYIFQMFMVRPSMQPIYLQCSFGSSAAMPKCWTTKLNLYMDLTYNMLNSLDMWGSRPPLYWSKICNDCCQTNTEFVRSYNLICHWWIIKPWLWTTTY